MADFLIFLQLSLLSIACHFRMSLKQNLLLIKKKQNKNNWGIGLDDTSETFGMVSPSAAAFTQSDQTDAVEKPVSSDSVCDTPGCVLAGKKKI